MTHDPYQTFAAYPAGAFTGLTNPGLGNPFSSPYSALQASGIPGAGVQQLGPQYAQQLQQAAIPQLMAMSPFGNPWQNAALTQHPFVAAAMQLQNPLLNPIVAQLAATLQPYSAFQNPYQQHHQQQQIGQAPGFGQQISPFGQFGAPLAPQSWVGQGVAGQGQIGGNPGYGQVNPLLVQLVARALQGAPSGINGGGWSGGF
jgi:hypothetical protein